MVFKKDSVFEFDIELQYVSFLQNVEFIELI
jgi:hypothetical protein